MLQTSKGLFQAFFECALSALVCIDEVLPSWYSTRRPKLGITHKSKVGALATIICWIIYSFIVLHCEFRMWSAGLFTKLWYRTVLYVEQHSVFIGKVWMIRARCNQLVSIGEHGRGDLDPTLYLTMEGKYFSETLIPTYKTIWC